MTDLGLGLGAGASALGGVLSFLGGSSANAANLAAQQQAQQTQYGLAQYQIANNNWLAENGISIRVNDAKNAGISPLVALGAPTFNPGPVQTLDVGGPTQSNALAGTGESLGRMGQDISRAAMVAQSDKTRADTIATVEAAKNSGIVAQSEAERNMADAALARKRAELLGGVHGSGGVGQSSIYGGKVDVGPATIVPAKEIGSDASGGGEANATPGVKWVSVPGGGLRMQPSLGTSEGATGESLGYSLNYRVPQAYDKNYAPPASMLPRGATGWHLDSAGNWYPHSDGGNRNWMNPKLW